MSFTCVEHLVNADGISQRRLIFQNKFFQKFDRLKIGLFGDGSTFSTHQDAWKIFSYSKITSTHITNKIPLWNQAFSDPWYPRFSTFFKLISDFSCFSRIFSENFHSSHEKVKQWAVEWKLSSFQAKNPECVGAREPALVREIWSWL